MKLLTMQTATGLTLSIGLKGSNEVSAIRDLLKDLLNQCTEKQQAFFLRMYPDGVDGMPKEKIPRAIEQVEATIKKNEKR